MKEPKAVTELPSSMTVVNLETGKAHHEQMAWKVMPPSAGKCQICGQLHSAEEPHNAQSMYYQVIFDSMVGRPPTWADAMAHCTDEVKAKWMTELKRREAWSEPSLGEVPVAHHGVEK